MGSPDGSALQSAAHIANEEIVRLLFQKGANNSVTDLDGYTPLHYAAGALYPHSDNVDDLVTNRIRSLKCV
jgi:hypothetical protein